MQNKLFSKFLRDHGYVLTMCSTMVRFWASLSIAILVPWIFRHYRAQTAPQHWAQTMTCQLAWIGSVEMEPSESATTMKSSWVKFWNNSCTSQSISPNALWCVLTHGIEALIQDFAGCLPRKKGPFMPTWLITDSCSFLYRGVGVLRLTSSLRGLHSTFSSELFCLRPTLIVYGGCQP